MSDFEASPSRRRKPTVDKPKTETRTKSNTRFSRMVSACGLSHVEAADFLDISKHTSAMKAAGLRPMFKEEEDELKALWLRVQDVTSRLDDSYPAGARRMQHAVWEIRRLLAIDRGEEVVGWVDHTIELDTHDHYD